MLKRKFTDKGLAYYDGVNRNTPMDSLEYNEDRRADGDILYTIKTNIGRITVLNRLTGYGNGIRDTETGFLSKDGRWWLASCECDVRKADGVKTWGDAVKWIKKHSNTCKGIKQ